MDRVGEGEMGGLGGGGGRNSILTLIILNEGTCNTHFFDMLYILLLQKYQFRGKILFRDTILNYRFVT